FARSAVQDLKLNFSLKNGRLVLKPVTAVIGSGKLQASASLREMKKKMVLRAALEIANLNAEHMLKELDISNALEGKFDISAALAGRGASVAELMAGANGHLSVIMGNGRFHNRLLAVVGGDLQAGLFKLLAPGDHSKKLTEINCLVTRFDITDGIAAARVLVLDTPSLSALGKGNINLKSEKLDISLDPIPKKGVGTDSVGKINLSLGNLAKPFKLGGTLADPSLAIDAKKAAFTIGKAVGGFALFGPFGLATLLLDGDAAKKDLCKTAVDLARQNRMPSKNTTPTNARKKEKKPTDQGSFLNGLKKMFK
ncbi:MAG: AsmA-like C-terminal region-containing protein, partial [Desulfobacterales bacterium]|nr:AsmA-like C-terminal region-containing protein [Desulfobacterales bacterium]